MAIDVKSINCPQCGSTDVTMISSTRIKCNSCGSQTLVKDIPSHQIVYNETHVHYDEKRSNETHVICSVKNMFSEEQFIRDAWIKLTQYDAPMDVLKENFGPVEHVEHETILDSITATVSFTADIGNDRQEPYIDYETYYENEPYYDNGVQKYRSVRKQRQVTKYRTVTDWTPISGSNTFESNVVAENKPGVSLNESAFRKCVAEALSDEENFGPVGKKKLKTLNNPNNANSEIKAKHDDDLYNCVRYSLPGDHIRRLRINITGTQERTATLMVSTEYKASLKYKDNDYTWSAFAFGEMDAFGEKIENKEGLENDIKIKKDEIPTLVWDKIKGISIITICMLAASIIVTFAVQNVLAIVLVFIAAAVLFVINCVQEHEAKKEITETVNQEIEDHTNTYRKKQLEVLNEKLSSLGLEKAAAEELGWKL